MINKLQIILLCLGLFACSKSKDVQPAESITVTIEAPTTLERLSNNVTTTFKATPSTPVSRIEYYFDGVSIGFSKTSPYTIKWTPQEMDGGEHTLMAVATTSKGKEFKIEQKIHIRLNIGDIFKGGKIFSLSGPNSGLIASTMDLEASPFVKFTWSASNTLLGANTSNGSENTIKMANAAVSPAEAGYHFKNGYRSNGYDDWYIPTLDELNMLKENMFYIGGFVEIVKDSYYWSSSEFSASEAQLQNMTALVNTHQPKDLATCRIRPVRKF
jgi:hypothetical protein